MNLKAFRTVYLEIEPQGLRGRLGMLAQAFVEASMGFAQGCGGRQRGTLRESLDVDVIEDLAAAGATSPVICEHAAIEGDHACLEAPLALQRWIPARYLAAWIMLELQALGRRGVDEQGVAVGYIAQHQGAYPGPAVMAHGRQPAQVGIAVSELACLPPVCVEGKRRVCDRQRSQLPLPLSPGGGS